MSSNTGTVTSVSSMLKSANALYTKQQAYDDQVAAYTWAQSAQGDGDYNTYVEYINGQMSKTSDPSKLLTYQKTLSSAFSSFTSNQIQQQAIGVLQGTSSLSDKQDTIGTLYTQAVANGDLNLATNLQQQYDSVGNEIQTQAQTAATAAQTLATTQADHEGTAYRDSADTLLAGLKTMTNEYKQGGQKAFDSALESFVQSNKNTLQALGVTIPTGGTTNLGLVTKGVVDAVGQYYVLASQATSVSDPSASDTYNNDAMNLANGTTKISTAAGSLDYTGIASWAQNPDNFVETKDVNTGYSLKQSTVAGYTFDKQGNITTVPSGTTKGNVISAQQKSQLQNMGFTVISDGTGGTPTVQLTSKSAKWLNPSSINAQNNEEIQLVPTANGFQFTNTDKNGANHLYTLGTDSRNLSAVYENNANGKNTMLNGQYGFNPTVNTVINGANVKQAQQAAVQKQVEAAQAAKQASAATILNAKNAPIAGAPKNAQLPVQLPGPTPAAPKPAAPAAAPATKGGSFLNMVTPTKSQPTQSGSALGGLASDVKGVVKGAEDVGKSVVKAIGNFF